jgi:hypothetical protein
VGDAVTLRSSVAAAAANTCPTQRRHSGKYKDKDKDKDARAPMDSPSLGTACACACACAVVRVHILDADCPVGLCTLQSLRARPRSGSWTCRCRAA